MSQPSTITVQILDKDYCITCPTEERANLERAARYLDDKMREIRRHGKVIGAERVAVMAALNITHDLLHNQKHSVLEAGPNREQLRSLLERADQALATDPDTHHNE